MCVACIVVKEGHKEYFIFITILLSSTAWAIVRALVRINRAVEITNEEKRVARCLKRHQLAETRKQCKQELGQIFDTLTHHPCEICLNGYIKFDNSLVLGIFRQAFTQFIVLMQLQN
ncbi:uncharacterized protein LOC118437459 [Folsomia candida]|uniref:uncharacterized protein LOC118437459 n=1 Tax=Folsomia candida TaxID=158441 RepID=UPI001604E606|nr:uncharacterized protein LOC118437459 [Folsomia candida]